MAVSDWIQFVALLVALGSVFWQSLQQTRLSRAAADATLIAKVDEANRVLLEWPELWKCLADEFEPSEGDATKARASVYMFMNFNNLELAWRHFKDYQLLAAREWQMWQVGLDQWVSKPYVQGWWVGAQDEYRVDFRALVDSRLKVVADRREQTASLDSPPSVQSIASARETERDE